MAKLDLTASVAPLQSFPAHTIAMEGAGVGKAVRFAAIDGLRGVACLLVLYCHCATVQRNPNWHYLTTLFKQGYGGADLFFVISGFCLSYPILAKPGRAVDWVKYFIGRVRRIIPPYWASLFLFAALSLLINRFHLQRKLGNPLPWGGKSSFLLGLAFWKVTLFATFWTLVVEWRWYFLFPLCIWLWRQAGAVAVLAALIAASAGSMTLSNPHLMDMNWTVSWAAGLFRYCPLFGLGILAAELTVTGGAGNPILTGLIRHTRWGLLVGIALVAVFHVDGADTPKRLCTWGVLGFFATLAAVRDPLISRVASFAPLVFVGTFSYSLYLVHGPFIFGFGYLLRGRLHSQPALLATYMIALPAVAIGLSYLFFLVAEKPFLKKSVRAAITAETTAGARA